MEQRTRALLIANWDYQNEARYPKLRDTLEADLETVKDALEHPQFGAFSEVRTRCNLGNDSLAREIEEFLQVGREQRDTLLIYYAGHGALTVGSSLALCGVDTESADRAFNTMVLTEWVRAKARASPTLLILDCCFGGAFRGGPAAAVHEMLRDPDGFQILSSTDNRPVLDSDEFARTLTGVLLDGRIPGVNGMLTPGGVHEQLTVQLPDSYRPSLKGTMAGLFMLARRPVSITPATLPGWREDPLREVDIAFTGDGVTVHWDGREHVHRFDRFDKERRWAIHRLMEMVDGVVSQPDPRGEWRPSLAEAWECIGANLFETALPPELRDLVRRAHTAGRSLLQLRLWFSDDSRRLKLEFFPWEQLASGTPGVFVQRMASRRVSGEASDPPYNAIVVNAFRDALRTTGERIRDDLHRCWAAEKVKYLGPDEATWINFLDALEERAPYLILVTPLVRQADGGDQKTTRLGFRGAPQSAATVLKSLEDRSLRFDCVVLVTYSSAPGRDSYRAVLDLAGDLTDAGHEPVVFVCHEPAYQAFLDETPGAETFAGLLMKALHNQKPVHRSFVWARNRVMERASPMGQASFGVPGLYAHHVEEPPVGAANVERRLGPSGQMTVDTPRQETHQ